MCVESNLNSITTSKRERIGEKDRFYSMETDFELSMDILLIMKSSFVFYIFMFPKSMYPIINNYT